jgi:hypothetical protein
MARTVLLILALLITSSAFGQRAVFYGQNVAPSGTFPTGFAFIAGSATGCYVLSASTTCSYNLHVNPTAGHLGWIMAQWESNVGTPTFSCTNNTSWTAIGSSVSDGTFRGQMFYIASLAGGAAPENCTLTINTSVNFLFWEYAEYSYSGTLSSLDGTPQYLATTASGGIATINGLTTAGSSDLVIGACIGVATSCTAGAGYTARNDTNACQGGSGGGNCGGGTTGQNLNSVIGSLIEEKVNVGAGAQTATFGTGTTDGVMLGLVAF